MRPEFIAGFVVAEGCFVTTASGTRFALTVAVGAPDGAICDALAAFFGVGRVYRYPRRREHHEDVAIYTVQSKRDLICTIVPFMDAYLPPSQKRRQYDRWRAALLAAATAAAAYSPEAVGSSAATACQSIRGASDHSRSRS